MFPTSFLFRTYCFCGWQTAKEKPAPQRRVVGKGDVVFSMYWQTEGGYSALMCVRNDDRLIQTLAGAKQQQMEFAAFWISDRYWCGFTWARRKCLLGSRMSCCCSRAFNYEQSINSMSWLNCKCFANVVLYEYFYVELLVLSVLTKMSYR